MRRSLLLTFLLAFATLPLAASAQTPDERRQLDWVAQRGRLIFDLDRAAWVGSDDMLARVPDPAGQGISGYIVERDGDAQIITFFGGAEGAPVALYRGRVERHEVVSRQVFAEDARPALTPVQRRLAGVRNMAGRLGRQPCGNAPFNTVVIPPETLDGPIDLYLLTSQTREDQWPLGGHYRFTIAADGSVQSSRAFTRSCVTLGADAAETQERPVALFITHLLDPIPTEIHVFTSLTAHLPLGVRTGTPVRTWWVAGDRIEIEHGQP
jgi:hypothetical protein